jgi:hypothetical protein
VAALLRQRLALVVGEHELPPPPLELDLVDPLERRVVTGADAVDHGRREQGDDADDDEELDQGEARPLVLLLHSAPGVRPDRRRGSGTGRGDGRRSGVSPQEPRGSGVDRGARTSYSPPPFEPL